MSQKANTDHKFRLVSNGTFLHHANRVWRIWH